ncbi:hypothetical protein Vi05172_g153 [Venturia inaequalis]|nr:hypothetical protein Vi05172_g153 [Venturia inaequalis]
MTAEITAVEIAAAEPAAVEFVAAEPAAVEFVAAEIAAAEPAAAEPAAAEPAAAEPVAVENTAAEFVAVENTAVEFVAVENTAVEFVAVENTAVEFVAVENTAVEFVAAEPAAVAEFAVAEFAVAEFAVAEFAVAEFAVAEFAVAEGISAVETPADAEMNSRTIREKVRKDFRKASRWLQLDDEEYVRLRNARGSFMMQSLENYIRALIASHDNDVLRLFALWLEFAESELANASVEKDLAKVPTGKFGFAVAEIAAAAETANEFLGSLERREE